MCAIFGSTERSKFISLYELNKDRGGYATTFSGIKNDTITTFKRKMFDIDNLYLEDWDYYLGHHQAPTSSVRKYSEKTSHPFNYGRWHVAHNGVLMNHKEVTEASDTREIDTSYIPAFMEELDLSHCKKITDIGIRAMAMGCKNIRKLNLSYTGNVKGMEMY